MRKPSNGRTAVKDSMPPLAEACPGFKGFRKGEKRADRIFDILLEVIQRYRAATSKRFYTNRAMAEFFGVSLCTMQVVCHRLNNEGVLTRVRSSQTTIAPRLHRPKFALRGVVCAPIWLPGFLHFRDWRTWFSELEEELSRHRFVLEPVFFKQSEECQPAFVDRVLKFNPDYVLWNSPASTDRMTMQSITDAGVPILSILGPRSPALPGRIYHTSNERALRRGLEDWKAGGQVDRIVIPHLAEESGDVAVHFGTVLHPPPLPYQSKPYDFGRPMPEYLASLAPDRRTGIFFGDQWLFALLCAMVPEQMFELFRQRRVIVLRQVTMHSFTLPTGISVDWLPLPSRRLARRIAEDLSQSKGALPSTEEVFEAEWRPHTPLKDIAQMGFNE